MRGECRRRRRPLRLQTLSRQKRVGFRRLREGGKREIGVEVRLGRERREAKWAREPHIAARRECVASPWFQEGNYVVDVEGGSTQVRPGVEFHSLVIG